MKYGFIGAGNMGGAIIKGIIKNKVVNSQDLYIYEKNLLRATELQKELGLNVAESEKDLVKNCDVVFLAVKPFMFKGLFETIKEEVKNNSPLLVSIAAGLEMKTIEEMAESNIRLVRVMPNLNAEVLQATSAVCKNEEATEEDINLVKKILSAIGSVNEIAENHFAIFSAIAGCSPAYVYMFINALAQGALRAGMPKKEAIEIAASAVMGSAKMCLESDAHPIELADRVCSPAGTTIEGVAALESFGFENAVIKAVEASIKRDKELGKN